MSESDESGRRYLPVVHILKSTPSTCLDLRTTESPEDPTARPGARAKTISIKRLSKRELDRGRLLYPETEYDRPKTRSDCLHGAHAERPCPFVSCKHHLYLDVNERSGSIKMNFPDLEVEHLVETCTLDVADRGGITLEEVGAIMNLTRERIRQLEVRSMAKLKSLAWLGNLTDYVDLDRVLADRRRSSVTVWGEGDEGIAVHSVSEDASGAVGTPSGMGLLEEVTGLYF